MPLFEPAGSVNISGAFTAKGDLLAGTGVGAYTALAVGGTNGWALVVDNTTATGMKWAAVSASATQVSLDSGSAGDYVARAKLTADTQYRVIEGIDASSRGQLLLGGGSAAGDARLVRTASGTLTIDANATAATSAVLALNPALASTGSTVNLFNLTNANAAISLQTGTGSTPLIALGPGTAAADIYVRRSAAKTLIVDTDGANGALTTVDFKTTNFYVNGSPITATATQVQRASGASGDYLAQIKLTADTTYRFSAELSSGAPQLLFGGGGVTAADIRMYRSQAGRLVLDTNGSSVWTEWGMVATSGQRAKIDQRVSGDPWARLEFSGDATLTGVAMGPGSANDLDVRLTRNSGGTILIDANGSSNATNLAIRSTSGQQSQVQVDVTGDSNPRAVLKGDATAIGIQLGPGNAALDLRLYRSAAKTLLFDDNAAGAATLDLHLGQLYLPSGAGKTLTATAGYVGWDDTTDDLIIHDGQRQRVAGAVGWAPAAYPIGFYQAGTYTTSLALAINGGSVACAIEVLAHMRIVSISYYNGVGTGTTEAKLYRQYLNNGNAGENTLTEVTGAGFASRTNTASAVQTVAVTTAGTYLAPGVYWLVLRNTSASVVFALGSLAAGTMARPLAQTKTLGSALASTLDFVAATWTKSNSVVGVRLNGEVFGQTTAF